jgi:hypothetical protein
MTMRLGDRVRYIGPIRALKGRIGTLTKWSKKSHVWVYVRWDEWQNDAAIKITDIEVLDSARREIEAAIQRSIARGA